MKPAKSGSGAKPKKAYYLLEAMQFTVPYIKALGVPSGNLLNPPEQKESFEQSEEIDFNNSELEPQPSSPFQQPLTPTLSSPSTHLQLVTCPKRRILLIQVNLRLRHHVCQTKNVD